MKQQTKKSLPQYLLWVWKQFGQTFAVWFLLVWAIAYIGSQFIGFGFNFSHSLPHKIYIINKKQKYLPDFKQGDFIAFSWQGEFYQHGTPIIKQIVGMSGDVVTENNREFFINNQSVGRAKEFSLEGKPLMMNSFRGEIPSRMIWVAASHKDSLDSRYEMAGLIHSGQIIGKAYPLF